MIPQIDYDLDDDLNDYSSDDIEEVRARNRFNSLKDLTSISCRRTRYPSRNSHGLDLQYQSNREYLETVLPVSATTLVNAPNHVRYAVDTLYDYGNRLTLVSFF